MIILHYIPSIDRSSGGVGSYMQILAKPLGEMLELHVVTHRSDKELFLENCHLHYIDRWKHPLCMKSQWHRLLDVINPDIVHVNCCWQPESAFVQKWSNSRGFKTVYSPHGMLEPWIMSRHYWTRKIPALLFYQRAAIVRSDVIHATADSERQNLLKLRYNNNVIVIPNGIDVRRIEMKDSWEKKKTLLFLSRIHVKKGIDLLINAVAELKDNMKGYQVLIAGEGDAGYIAELKNLTKQKGVNGIVRFIGGVYGDTKWELYRNADILVLPTHSENFGIVVAEALASGTPVITTTGTPWDELNTKQCGWCIPCNKIDLKQTIISAISLTGEKLEQYGRNGRLLIEERYSADTVAQKMKLLYDRIITNQIY